jgi:chaperonin GroEL
MMPRSIIDPAKVVRVALPDASSVAGLLVTTEAMVAPLALEMGQSAPPEVLG